MRRIIVANILLILADNWAYPHASACGDPVVSTPNFDRIVREGALFSNAFCQVPSCSPARAVLLTGQACHRLRDAANLWGSWPHSLRTYPELLEDSGYRVGQEIKGWGPGVVFQKSNARRNRNPAGRKFDSFSSFLDKTPGRATLLLLDRFPQSPPTVDRRSQVSGRIGCL